VLLVLPNSVFIAPIDNAPDAGKVMI